MPDILLQDGIVAGGVINTNLEPSDFKIWGSHISVSVEVEPTQVRLRGTELYLRVYVRWAGGTTDPTVLAVWPDDVWTPNVDVFVEYYGNSSAYEWRVHVATYASGSRHAQLAPVSGLSFTQLTNTGFLSGTNPSPGFQYVSFIMKDSNGNPVYPQNGEECWILVVPD